MQGWASAAAMRYTRSRLMTPYPLSLLQHGVAGLAFLHDVDDQELDRIAADVRAHVPLPHRLQNEIARIVGVDLAGFQVGHAQLAGQDIGVAGMRMAMH